MILRLKNEKYPVRWQMAGVFLWPLPQVPCSRIKSLAVKIRKGKKEAYYYFVLLLFLLTKGSGSGSGSVYVITSETTFPLYRYLHWLISPFASRPNVSQCQSSKFPPTTCFWNTQVSSIDRFLRSEVVQCSVGFPQRESKVVVVRFLVCLVNWAVFLNRRSDQPAHNFSAAKSDDLRFWTG